MTSRPTLHLPGMVPIPEIPGSNEQVRIINENFRRLVAVIQRALELGNLGGNLGGDVTGPISAARVVKIQHKALAAPAAGDTLKVIQYLHASGIFQYVTLPTGITPQAGWSDPTGTLSRAALIGGGATVNEISKCLAAVVTDAIAAGVFTH